MQPSPDPLLSLWLEHLAFEVAASKSRPPIFPSRIICFGASAALSASRLGRPFARSPRINSSTTLRTDAKLDNSILWKATLTVSIVASRMIFMLTRLRLKAEALARMPQNHAIQAMTQSPCLPLTPIAYSLV